MNFKVIMTTLLILYTIGIFVIAIIPNLSGVQGLANHDKLIHATEYFIFTLLILATFAVDEISNYYAVALIVILTLIILSETVQIPIIERTFDVRDMIADLSGVALGYILFFLGRKEWLQFKQ